MKSILITGCNRGIGYGLVKYLAENENLSQIFATCRNPEKAKELQEIAKKHRNVNILKADITKESDIQHLTSTVSSITKDEGLNVLINNAGISTKFCRLQLVKQQDLEEHFKVNTIAPILLSKAFVPLLKKPDKSRGGTIINMSSILGSIAENKDGGFYPYRTSKTALNAATKSMSVDLKQNNIIVISLHPGWLKTDMGGANAPLTVESVAPKIINFIKTATSQHNGLFYSYDGKQLPW